MDKLIFSRESYMKDKGLLSYVHNKYWVNKCNNKEVIQVKNKYECEGYTVSPIWCKKIKE